MPSPKATYVVTGASRGIGLELTRQLVGSGATVIATCRSPDKAEKLQEIKKKSPHAGQLTIFPLDVTNEQSIATAAQTVEEDFPQGIDVLVNNAGVASQSKVPTLLEGSYDDMLGTIQTNTLSPIMVTRAFLPLLERRPASSHGLIVNMSSILGSIASPFAGTGIYALSKAGLNAVTAHLSAELKSHEHPVAVLSVHPGWVATDMGNSRGRSAPLTPQDSVKGILQLLHRDAKELDGKFLDYTGKEILW